MVVVLSAVYNGIFFLTVLFSVASSEHEITSEKFERCAVVV